MFRRFKDRGDAGQQLARMLTHLHGQNVIVLGLPRGGLAVAYEVAHHLGAPLDVLNVRKIGVPWHPELAMGAVAAGGVRVLNDEIILATGVTQNVLDEETALQRSEIDRREELYRGGRPALALAGRVVVLVDDGIASGATVRAAIAVVRAQHPARLVLAAPVAQASVAAELAQEVDELVCVRKPADLYAISVWYDTFPQLTDRDVRTILGRAQVEPPTTAPTDVRSAPG
jgi:putative phosphoribosyl transferase